jgi:hypothetical protein
MKPHAVILFVLVTCAAATSADSRRKPIETMVAGYTIEKSNYTALYDRQARCYLIRTTE